jgi:hypothetical protein
MSVQQWPPVIVQLARDAAMVAKNNGLHGKVTIRRTPTGDYVVAIVVPADTVPDRSVIRRSAWSLPRATEPTSRSDAAARPCYEPSWLFAFPTH